MAESMPVAEHVYDETMQITGTTDFGIDMGSALTGAKTVPPEGVRVDVDFSGELQGPRIKGKITGTDFVLIMPGGVTRLDVRAVIVTDDGARIAFYADGYAPVEKGAARLLENVRLHTAAPAFLLVNSTQFWATGEIDLVTVKSSILGFRA